YWVEFSGMGSPDPPVGTGCTLYLHGALDGNGWAMRDWDHYGAREWTVDDALGFYECEDGIAEEFAFCIQGGFSPPPPMSGACCLCDGTCLDNQSWEECMGHSEFDCVNPPYATVYLDPPVGKFHPRRQCVDLECVYLGEAGGCPGEPGRPGEDCVNPAIVTEGTHYFTNICSTTDGAASYPVCDNQNNLQIAADVWYEYHACDWYRRIDIDVCNADFDTVLAVYTNGTPVCPECDDPNLNDYLEPVGCRDIDCPWGGPTAATYADVADQCFLIRIGGYNGPFGEAGLRDNRGNGELEIGCGGCYPSSRPEPELLIIPQPPASPAEYVDQKMRYLSFSAGDPSGTGPGGRTQAVRITFDNLPAPYDVWNGVQMWVQQPEEFCENAGVVSPPCPDASPRNTWLGAALGCDPWFDDFYAMTHDAEGNIVDAIHVYHEGIIPGGYYWIEVTEEGCAAAGFPEGSFSAPLCMRQSAWGDVVDNCVTYPCRPPNGVVDFIDVSAVLDRFKNLGPPEYNPAVVKVRAEHDWETPNQRIDVSDVTFCLDAFLGVCYPPAAFTPPGEPPCAPEGPSGLCQPFPVCGDEIVQAPEECDDGGESGTCDADCTYVVCGDGTVNTTVGEECDPPNGVTCDGNCLALTTFTDPIRLVPVGNDPQGNLDPGVTLVGNQITLPSGGHRVFLEIEVPDWDPDAIGLNLKTWQVAIDSTGYTSGLHGTLTPWRPSCTTDSDCETLMGPLGTSGAKGGCGVPGVPAGVCAAGFINNTRTDYLCSGKAELPGVDQSTLCYRFGSTMLGAPFPSPHVANMYAGTLVLDVPADTKGTFTVGFTQDLSQNCLVDQNNRLIPLMGLEPARITVAYPGYVPAGSDCYQTECGLTVFSFYDDPIPADFFAAGSEPFDSVVFARGSGQSECLHGYDTVIGRLDDMVFDDIVYPSTRETAMKLRCLDLESCEPIEVQTPGGPTYWNVGIELSSVAAPDGTLRATKTHLNGGIFRMEYSAQLKYRFSSVADAGDVRIFDTGKEGRDPIELGTVGEIPWVHQPTIPVFTCGENFTPGIDEQPPPGGVANSLPDTQCCNKDSSSGPEGTHQTGPTDCSACPVGACCLEDGTCVVAEPTGQQVAKQVCEDDLGGTYTADHTDCTDTDGDEIADVFETNNIADAQAPEPWATGTCATAIDTDGDGCGDKYEILMKDDPEYDPGNSCLPPGGCKPCVPEDNCDEFLDYNENDIPDPCDVIQGRDCDGDRKIGPADLVGACCHGVRACAEQTRAECLAHTPDPAEPWTFRGFCTKCPDQGGGTAEHDGVIVRHFPRSADPLEVCVNKARESRNDCVEGDFIDAWATDPFQDMRHNFGVEGSPPIPAGFFGEGSDPFEGQVRLEGVPLGGEFGIADTLIKRSADPFDRCVLPSTTEVPVDAEIMELSLGSVKPITVTYNGGQDPEQWEVTVDLSPNGTPPLGEVRAKKIHCNGGIYTSILHAYPRFTFTKVGVPEPPTLDTAQEAGFTYITLYQVGEDAEHWVSDLGPGVHTLTPYCTDFHPAIEPTESKRRELRQIPCDCNDNGIRDKCDIEGDTSHDCNQNRVPDECDTDGGGSEDCQDNDIPDECEVDCNHNMVPDDCDIAGDTSQDCQPNGIPDECEDCNDNGVGDSCDIAGETSEDCQPNGIPDDCERDCNANGVADSCDIVGPTSEDVDGNGLPDECDCLPSTAPEPELLVIPQPPAEFVNQKMRYLSFTAGDAGRQQAVCIRFHNLPPPYNAWNGVKMWVQEPEEFCENAGQVRPPCANAEPRNTWLGAALGCDPWLGDFYSLTQHDAIHVFHEGIIPGGTFVIQVVEDGCPLNLASSYSDPLAMTMSSWGDLIRNCTTCPCTPPDGVVGIPTDVTAVLDKFKNLAPPSMPCYAVVKV
ncbi:MAG: hypothetical protein JSU86_15980, partial [Phycisphaerales bacterium]